MKFTIQDISHITGAELYGAETETPVESVIFDSRSLARRRGTMFAALSTEGADGHRFIGQLYDAGLRVFMVERLPDSHSERMPDATFIVVPSVFEAIERMGAEARNRLGGKVIAITGSQGKTVVKEMLYTTLVPVCKVWRSPRSWNSRLGVPVSLLEAPADADVYIVECGIDRPSDMEHLQRIVRPDMGILTSITPEHDANFVSSQQKLDEKLKLFVESEVLIHNAACRVPNRNGAVAVQSDSGVDALNIALCAAAVQALGIDAPVSSDALHVRNRIDVHEGVNDCVMLFDGFTHDMRSLTAALDFMRRRATPSRTSTLICGDLADGGPRDIVRLAEYYGVSRIIVVGNGLSVSESGSVKVECAESVDDFLNRYDINSFSSETILISGNPAEQFAAIRNALESPRHDTIFEVNLDAIVHNYNYFRSLLKPSTGLVAMVKASGYGVGALQLSRTLQTQGAAYLAVAVIDEAVELRRGGITMPIVVLNPVTTNYRALFRYNLEPSVFSLRELNTLVSEARRAGVERFKAHIKLDTGMHRVGFTEAEVPALVEALKQAPELQVASVFSHLATADCPDQNDYTQMQLDTFDRVSQSIINALPYKVLRHILNTAGILTHPEHQYDMVRLGIGLYGISPLQTSDPSLMPVVTLKSTIISLKEWEPGTTIGYGRRGLVNRRSVIATIPIGYADGLDRRLSRGNASFTVRGVACPTVGNICMDQCMIDVTDVPGVEIGDEVEIFGTSPTAETLAATLDTIPYEVLTSVSQRVKRIYYSL